jgi:tetraacyldisaccharide 4'-kinase
MKPRSLAAKLILLPMSKIYGMITWVRNKMFDTGILKQHEFQVPVVAIGNIAVGGTGKTPHTEYIINALRSSKRIGVLSRGYKRDTKGFVLATPHTTPRDIGDEAYQIYHKFNREVMVAVCEKRVTGIEQMLEIDPNLELILLDDAFQHRYVKPKVAIVLTEYDRPVYEDKIMPYGRLRESIRSLNRADIVIATKCPDAIKPLEYSLFDKNLNLFPAQSLFFSRYRYQRLRPVFSDHCRKMPELDQLTEHDMLLAVSGIGNPRPFVRYLKSFKAKVKVNVFPDHHDYTRKDIDLLLSRFDSMSCPEGEKYIVTTEKDAVRLINNPYFPHELKPYIFFMPVRVEFVVRDNDKTTFEQALLRRLNSNILK